MEQDGTKSLEKKRLVDDEEEVSARKTKRASVSNLATFITLLSITFGAVAMVTNVSDILPPAIKGTWVAYLIYFIIVMAILSIVVNSLFSSHRSR